MKRFGTVLFALCALTLSGCGQDLKPPVYANSATDITINTTRYIQPVMQKGQVAETEATIILGGSGSYERLKYDVDQAHEAINKAKGEVSLMTYPEAMAPQKAETITSLTTLSVDLDKLLASSKTGKGLQPAIEIVISDLNSVQASVQIAQGK